MKINKLIITCIQSNFWLKVALGIALGLTSSWIDWYEGCNGNYYAYNLIFSIIGSILIWSGSEFIACIADQRYSWEAQPLKRVLFKIIFNLAFILLIVMLIFTIIAALKGSQVPAIYFWQTFRNSTVVTLIVNLIYVNIDLYNYWNNSRSEVALLKKEHLKSQLESLKNQINPHFLFNSLNTLISVIDEHPEVAKNYTQSLSQVYRYILQARDKELSTLREELVFLESYTYLLKIRFGDNLIFNIKVPEAYFEYSMPTLVLQTLVENCIKHNIISSSKPLIVSIFIENDQFLVIQNNLQVKKLNVESEKIGLKNTNERYRLTLGKEIVVHTDNQHFTVKLPLK